MPDTVPSDRPKSQPASQSVTSSAARAERLGLLLDGLRTEIAQHEQAHVDAMVEALAYREMFLWTMDELLTERKKRERLEERLRQVMGVQRWHPEENGA